MVIRNKKERRNMGGQMYYYGARIFVWLSVDALATYDPFEQENFIDGKHNGGIYNSFNHGVYTYCYQNPIKLVDPKAKSWKQFEEVLKQQRIAIEYKRKGQTNEIQSISFKKGEHYFKGSDVDRKFSYSKLDTQLNENSPVQEQRQATIPEETGNTLAENIASGVTDVLSGIGGLFDVHPSNQDEKEAEYLRQQALKKKKKPDNRKEIRR
jgi:hypothetical protein